MVLVNPTPANVWNGPTAYPVTACAMYSYTGTTDANGRIVFNLTKDGTTTGPAIFSKLFSVTAQAKSLSTTDVTKCAYAVIEAQTTKQVTVRLLTPVTTLILGATMAFAGAGYQCDLEVRGAS